VTAIVEYDISALEQRVDDTLTAYQQKAEPLGLDFGRACYELRKAYASNGGYGSKGKGLAGYMQVRGVSRGTYQYWIERHEILIGEREPASEVEVVPADWSPKKPAGSVTTIDDEDDPAPPPPSNDKTNDKLPNHVMWDAKPPALKDGILILWGGKLFRIEQGKIHSDRLVLRGEWS
jgi:hypothetical protein